MTGRKLGKFILGLMAVNVVLAMVAQVCKWLLPSFGGEDSNEARLVSIMDGVEARSRAVALHELSVITALGSLRLDLRAATPSELGAVIRVTTVLGGTEIVAPATWHVHLVGSSLIGTNHVDTLSPGQLSASAPQVTIYARSVLGATEVTTEPHIATFAA